MKRFLATGTILNLAAGLAAAQGVQVTITYTPLANTPAPGTMALLALGLLFLAFTYRKMRKAPMGRTLAAIALFGGLAITGTRRASATSSATIMTGPSPLQFNASPGITYRVVNGTGTSETITGISAPSPYTFQTPTGSPQCQVAMVLGTNAGVNDFCYVSLANAGS